jgi:uncharacterized protein
MAHGHSRPNRQVFTMKSFIWHEVKRLKNLQKHDGIDFAHVDVVFEDERSVIFPSSREGEQRWVIVGLMKDRIISVVYTLRGDVIRIISARVARDQEKSLWLRNVSKNS